MPLAVCIALCKGDYHCFHVSVHVVGWLVCLLLGVADVVSCPCSTCKVMSARFSTFFGDECLCRVRGGFGCAVWFNVAGVKLGTAPWPKYSSAGTAVLSVQ